MVLLRYLDRFLRLQPVAKRLLIFCLALQMGIRLGLWLSPYLKIQGLAEKWANKRASRKISTDSTFESRVVWAIMVSSRLVPRCTCLVRALAAQILFRRGGVQTELRVGIAKDSSGQLKGHAWLEKNGEVLIGGMEDLSRYTLLPLLEAKESRAWS